LLLSAIVIILGYVIIIVVVDDVVGVGGVVSVNILFLGRTYYVQILCSICQT
jgi:hypothetical protein